MSRAANVVPFLPRPVAQELIHRLAREDKFILEPACKEKMRVRDFSEKQVRMAMTQGSVNQGPAQDEYGDYRCRLRNVLPVD
jgi:5-formyltetrahydrofolate cyclo-ligase